MRVRGIDETSLELFDVEGHGLAVDDALGWEPIEMFVTSLALCAYSAVSSYSAPL